MNRNKIKSDGGGGANYYDLPKGATQLQDLIEYRNMNGSIKDIFKGCFRMGLKDGGTDEYDMRKIVFYGLRELGRILNRKDYLTLAEEVIGHQHEDAPIIPNDDIVDSFKYFKTPFTEGGIVPDDHDNDDIDYENLLRDDEHEDNIDKVYHTNEPLEGFEVVEGRFYIGNTYIGIGKMTIPIIKVD